MKTVIHGGKSKLLLSIAVILLASGLCFAQENQPFSINTSPLPDPTGFVNDYAGVIDADTRQSLETRLKEFKDKTNPQVEIAIAVIRTTGGRDISEYSLAVARGWKIGSKADDNPSALLMVAIDDRKYFTQVSRDLEDELPDGVVGSLQRQFLVPEFRKGNYAKGVADTIEAYITTIESRTGPGAKATPPVTGPRTEAEGGIFSTFCCMVIILIIILIILSRSNRGGGRGGNDRWGGGGFGGGGGALPWIIGSIIANAGSSSGSSSGGWGGSSGGGGFGGFGGGGDFGGGGAGGDW